MMYTKRCLYGGAFFCCDIDAVTIWVMLQLEVIG